MRNLLFRIANTGLLILWVLHTAILLPIFVLVAILRLCRWELPHDLLQKYIAWFEGKLHFLTVKTVFIFSRKIKHGGKVVKFDGKAVRH